MACNEDSIFSPDFLPFVQQEVKKEIKSIFQFCALYFAGKTNNIYNLINNDESFTSVESLNNLLEKIKNQIAKAPSFSISNAIYTAWHNMVSRSKSSTQKVIIGEKWLKEWVYELHQKNVNIDSAAYQTFYRAIKEALDISQMLEALATLENEEPTIAITILNLIQGHWVLVLNYLIADLSIAYGAGLATFFQDNYLQNKKG